MIVFGHAKPKKTQVLSRAACLICSVLICIMFLTGCSANKSIKPAAEKELSPGALLYFSLGSALFESEEYEAAEEHFRQALLLDPNNLVLIEHSLKANANLYLQGKLTESEAAKIFEALYKAADYNEEMMYFVYVILRSSAQKNAIDTVTSELLRRYNNPLYSVIRFDFEKSFLGRTNVKLLDKALASTNEYQLLCYIAENYVSLDPAKSISAAKKARAVDRTVDIDEFLLNMYYATGNTGAARALYKSYKYPEDKDFIESYVLSSNQADKYDEVKRVADQLMAMNDRYLLYTLAGVTLINEDLHTLRRIETFFRSVPDSSLHDNDLIMVFTSAQLCYPDLFPDVIYYEKIQTSRYLVNLFRLIHVIEGSRNRIAAMENTRRRLSAIADETLREHMYEVMATEENRENLDKTMIAYIRTLIHSG
ncbi:MAG: tetratricopeptide repeat protein, partial [Candidatus Cloacimonadaceae bacterium]|nr:tetratricopeptide repeat protein [Candidatus Cloacimonadaceae bacterium]